MLDLGANIGFFTLVSAALTGPSGRMIAYEPMPANAAALERNVELNALAHVAVVRAAVSDRIGVSPMFGNGSDQDASLLGGSELTALQIPTVTVDTEVARLGLAPALVKIDVEGAEHMVAAGMAQTLRTHRPTVICEMHAIQHDFESPMARILAGAGYALSWLEPRAAEVPTWAPHLIAVPASRRSPLQSTTGAPPIARTDC